MPVGDMFFFAGLGVRFGAGKGSLFGGEMVGGGGLSCASILGMDIGENVFGKSRSFLVFCPGRLPCLVLGP